MLTDCDNVSVWLLPYPSSHALYDPVRAAWELSLVMTPDVAVHGAVPVSKLLLPIF